MNLKEMGRYVWEHSEGGKRRRNCVIILWFKKDWTKNCFSRKTNSSVLSCTTCLQIINMGKIQNGVKFYLYVRIDLKWNKYGRFFSMLPEKQDDTKGLVRVPSAFRSVLKHRILTTFYPTAPPASQEACCNLGHTAPPASWENCSILALPGQSTPEKDSWQKTCIRHN